MINKKYSRRKNRKIKFSEDRYIEKYYMKDDIAVIPVELKKETDLYMRHDFKKMELSDSVCAYIEEIAYMVPINTDIIIEIHCPRVPKSKQDKMKRAIRNNYGMEIDEIEYDIKTQNKRSFILLFFGLVLLVLNFFLEKYKYIGTIVSNFMCVVWWVAIWNFIELQTLDKGENVEKRLNYQQLYDAKVTFVFPEKKLDSKKIV